MSRILKIGGGLALLAGVLGWLLFFSNEAPSETGTKSLVEATEVSTAPTIAVVLPAKGPAELDVWEMVTRRQEERTRAIATIHRLAPSDPPSSQADVIRKVAAEGASAVIVVAADAAAVAPAIAEVRKAGTPVVLLDVPVSSEGESPIPIVRYEDEEAVAKKLVDAAVADARDRKVVGVASTAPGRLLTDEGFPSDGPAIILRIKTGDTHSDVRIAGLQKALKEAGIRVLPIVEFEGLIEEAKIAVKAAHKITPHLAMIFADDDLSMKGASEYRHMLDKSKRRFVLAGYIIDPVLMELSRHNVVAGVVDRKILEPMRIAFDKALALAKGEPVELETRSPTPFFRRNGPEVEGAFPAFLDKPEIMKEKRPDSAGDPDQDVP